jgi:rSAM/selenodomain-associated transferase 1
MYQYPNAVLMIFCKAPVAGQVKTRLSSVLTPDQCVEVHTELSNRALQLATQSHLCPVQLWCSPSTEHPFFSSAATTYGLTLRQQLGNNLGERMHHAFCSALATYNHALIIGCDCPSLTESDLVAALTALTQGNEIVLATAEDGGYVLIGLNKLHPELFQGISWGTSQVLAQTRARIKQVNFQHVEIKEQWDVDTPADLLRYYAHINKPTRD